MDGRGNLFCALALAVFGLLPAAAGASTTRQFDRDGERVLLYVSDPGERNDVTFHGLGFRDPGAAMRADLPCIVSPLDSSSYCPVPEDVTRVELGDMDDKLEATTSSGLEVLGGDGNDDIGSYGGLAGGGDGNDDIDLHGGLAEGGNGNDDIDLHGGLAEGGDGNDVIATTYGDATMRGGAGDDTIWIDAFGAYAYSDNVVIEGGAGNDGLQGARSYDGFNLGPGEDEAWGLEGGDWFNSADGEVDTVHCGPGQDTVYADHIDVLDGCENVTYAP